MQELFLPIPFPLPFPSSLPRLPPLLEKSITKTRFTSFSRETKVCILPPLTYLPVRGRLSRSSVEDDRRGGKARGGICWIGMEKQRIASTTRSVRFNITCYAYKADGVLCSKVLRVLAGRGDIFPPGSQRIVWPEATRPAFNGHVHLGGQ